MTMALSEIQIVSLEHALDSTDTDALDLDAELVRIERNFRIYRALDTLDELARWIVCRHTGFPLEPGDDEERPVPVRELASALKKVVSRRFTVKYTAEAIEYGLSVLADQLTDFEGVGF